jgi:hypothetical protein
MLKKACAFPLGAITLALLSSCGGGNKATGPSRSAPAVTTQPRSQLVHRDSSVTFRVDATGSPVPAYQWLKNDTALPGKTEASCTLDRAAFGDSGIYKVVVSNSEGSVVSDPATLTVYTVTITVQPASDTVPVGSPFTLTAVPQGIPAPIYYQWRQTGFDVPGADSAVYTKVSASTDDAGVYRAVVTCPLGTVYSDSVALTVIP